ncbi:MAG: hypothetical protein LBN95_12225 [Prevotellaceae bacterium]|jgi:transcription-repair coupling factor (superfamily II helicase)|nr:hypothetical protein [Prevotellaceae bacterium]
MTLTDFFHIYSSHPLIKQICEWSIGADRHLSVGSLFASARQAAVCELFNQSKKNILFVADDAESAGYAFFDISQIVDKNSVAMFPALYKKINKSGGIDKANEILRTDALNKINSQNTCITVTYPDALLEKVISFDGFDEIKITLKKNQNFDTNILQKKLEELGFEEVDFVYEAGQFSVRGSIIDIFSFANELPYRLDFFGDTVESIRIFDIEKQLSISEVEEISIVPDIQLPSICGEGSGEGLGLISLLEFMPKDTIVLFNSLKNCAERIDETYTEALVKENENRKTSCHSREGGNPQIQKEKGYSRLRGNDTVPDLLFKFINKEIFLSQIEEFRIIEFSAGAKK